MNPIFPVTRKDLLNVVGTLLLLAVAFFFFFKVNPSTAKNFDREWGFWLQVTLLGSALLGLLINLPQLIKLFHQHQPKKLFWLACFIITLFVGTFATQEIELQHRVLSDESSWESMGIQMYYNHRAGICNQGIFSVNSLDCFDEVNNFKGKTTGIFYWVMFHFLPTNRDSTLLLNLPLFLISLPLLFYGIFLIFNRPWVGLSAALFLGTMPKMLFQSRTATTEVAYVFLFCLVATLIAIMRKGGYRWQHLLLILPLVGLLAGTRQETLFSFIPLVLIYGPLWRKLSWGLPALVSGLMLVCFPIVVTIAAYKGFNFQGGEYEAHSFYNLFRNFWDNILVMLNLEEGYQGLLNYPFSTTQMTLIYGGSIFLTLSAIWTGKYHRGLVLFCLWFVQAIVVMVNVSGNFTIDINQRYVLIILPIFSIIGALFVEEIFILFGKLKLKKTYRGLLPPLAFFFLGGLNLGLVIHHKESFNYNIHYRKNKLLAEEKFLNEYLKTLPHKSIFIYARPWQMISQHLNAFSETRFLGWNNEEFNQWLEKTDNNIYLIRGQDAYGKVNKKSRVVGFKTTDKVERILKNFQTEELIRQTRPFGYALTVSKLLEKKSSHPFLNKVTVKISPYNKFQDSLLVSIKKKFPGALKLSLATEDLTLGEHLIQSDTIIQLPHQLTSGIHRINTTLTFPDSSLDRKKYSVSILSSQTKILTKIKPQILKAGWGNPRLNKSIENNSLKVKGEIFPWGIGTHTDSRASFDLKSGYKKLNISMGMDDEAMCGDGAIFIIHGDGKELFRSQPIYGEEIINTEVSVNGIKILDLITLQGETDLCDHSNWLNPWLTRF